MSTRRFLNTLRKAGLTGLLACTLTASGAGFTALAAYTPAWTPESAANTEPIPSTAWSPASEMQAVLAPVLDGIDVAPAHATIQGTDPARISAAGSGTASARQSKPHVVSAVLAANPAAGNDKGSGDFAALPGTSAGTWGATGQTGGFTWSYPLTARPGPAGDAPSVSLSYDSSRVDGLTSSTNNQASVVGDGWALGGAGVIQQRFTPCTDQGVTNSYDLCGEPGGQQFTISFGGRSGPVVKDAATGTYRLQNDDNTRIEYVTEAGSNGTYDGGYWRLTDTTGTQYFFGRNKLPGWGAGSATTNSTDTVPVGAANPGQPCAAGSFAASLCQQAYAWRLDYTVDLHGNSQAFYYSQDKNSYAAQAGTGSRLEYVRASRLARIDYGMRAGTELGSPAPLRMAFDYAARCDGVDCAVGNDVPTTFTCTQTGDCSTDFPTFYSDQRLKTITTQTNTGGSTYQSADVWTLHHSMPDPGDLTKPALWLGSIDHQGVNTATGTGPAITDPPVVFGGQALQNRVWVVDGLAPLDRYRIAAIKTVTGASIAVNYLAAECTPTNLPASPETNTKRCFPQWWTPTTPLPQPARMDYFHTYPVASIGVLGGPGGTADLLTRYEYVGTPAWKYDGPKFVAGAGGSQLTWSELAGWPQVKTITGNAGAGLNPTSTTTYLRGLDGTPSNGSGGTNAVTVTASDGTVVTDSPWLAGTAIESQTYLGETGGLLSSTITAPWSSAPTATSSPGTGSMQARHTDSQSMSTRTASSSPGGWRTTTTTNTFDSLGRVKAVSDAGDTAVPGDDTCTVTVYADNATVNLLGLAATTTTYAGTCTTGGDPTGTALRGTRALYDQSASATPGSGGYTAPTKGEPARTDTSATTDGGAIATWVTGPSLTFDALGRTTVSTDTTTGTPRTTSTVYTPATGPVTSTTVTNPLGWTTTTTYDAIRGQQTSNTDVNANATTYRYDASGRVTGVWDPMRPQATNPVPTQATTYQVSQSSPSWVRTDTMNGNGAPIPSYKIYDGLGRIRQTKSLSPGGGTIATETLYNGTGQKQTERNAYYLAEDPDGILQIPNLAVPSSTQYDYDGAGRPTAITALAYDNQVQWATNIAYTGMDTVTTTGPGNESASRSTVNAQGSVVTRDLFRGTTATGTPDTVTYQYDALGQQTAMTDTAGNSWTWSFDAAGRPTGSTDPDTGATTATYDASGRTATTTNAAGTTTGYVYDVLDRKTSRTVALSGGQPQTLVNVTYDGEKKGQVTSSTRFNGANFDQPVTTTVSGYNAAYKPKTVKTELPSALGGFAGSYTTSRTYSKAGNVTGKQSPAIGGLPAETLYYGYDEFDRPSSLYNQYRDTYAGNTEYNHLGTIATFLQYDRFVVSGGSDTTGTNRTYYNWDATTGRLAQQWSTNITNGFTADLGKTSYNYAPSGKLTSRDTAYASRPGAPVDYQCYDYDYASRLAAVWTPASKACTTAPAPADTAVAGLGGPAAYAQTYTYTAAGDRSQVKRFGLLRSFRTAD